jgi:copper oxidase (laccase) domain-containing protein
VAEAFRDADPDYEAFIERRDPKYHIDLKAIIRHDLVKKGVKDENVLDMGLCTKCNKDDFFSHRGHKGKRGLMVAAMRLVE